MLDAVSIEKLAAHYGSLFYLLDIAKVEVEDFTKALAVADPERTSRVLRELTEGEASLLFADFSIFMGVERRKRDLAGQGYANYEDTPGGVFLHFLDHHVGIPSKILLASAYAEFGTTSEIKAGTHSIRFEIVDGAICYVMYEPEKDINSKDIATILVGQALQSILNDRSNGVQNTKGQGIDLMSWEPDSEKIH